MIIRISEVCLENPRWHLLLDLVASFIIATDSRHSFDPFEIPKLKKSAWLQRGADSSSRAHSGLMVEAMRRNAVAKFRTISSDAVTLFIDDNTAAGGTSDAERRIIRCSPWEALTIIMRPFSIVVENENTDGAFLLWMARLLGVDAIRSAYNAGALTFRHAGGKGLLIASAKALSYGVWPREGRPVMSLSLRAAAILDSDSRFPGDAPNAALALGLKPHVSFVHVLQGRAIENYVPPKYVRKRLAPSPAADALLRLSVNQRRHFPIKAGFRGPSRPSTPQSFSAFQADTRRPVEERNLYKGIHPRDWSRISPGVGDTLADVYQDPASRSSPEDAHGLEREQMDELSAVLLDIVRHL